MIKWQIPNLNFSVLWFWCNLPIQPTSCFALSCEKRQIIFCTCIRLVLEEWLLIGCTVALSNEDQGRRYVKQVLLWQFPSLYLSSPLTPLEPNMVSLCWCFTDIHEFVYLLFCFISNFIKWKQKCFLACSYQSCSLDKTDGNSQEASLCPFHQYLVQIFQ